MTQVAIQLPDDLSQFVNESVQAGDFPTADEFFIHAVSIYKDQIESQFREADATKLERLRQDIQTAADQLDRGEGIEMDWEAKRARLHRDHAARHPA
ncbi:hypothetical protein GCM10023213_12490 [Prosthecobacter algae]|uniref:Antitoxin ParD1/3/4 n=1 Tax=Prosthecobacter algae TaxID=1144682 RepID=A0ABP9NZD1_9BACT